MFQDIVDLYYELSRKYERLSSLEPTNNRHKQAALRWRSMATSLLAWQPPLRVARVIKVNTGKTASKTELAEWVRTPKKR